MVGFGIAGGISALLGDWVTGAGETEVIVVACETDFLTFGVRLRSL